jgi:hypothetical protein
VTSLRDAFALRRSRVLVPLAERIEAHLKILFTGFARIDRISARANELDRFLPKAQKQDGGKLSTMTR